MVIEINFSCKYHVIRCICLAVIEKIVVARERINPHGPRITHTCNHIMCFPTTSYIINFSLLIFSPCTRERINQSLSLWYFNTDLSALFISFARCIRLHEGNLKRQKFDAFSSVL